MPWPLGQAGVGVQWTMTASDMVLIGTFVAVMGYLIRYRHWVSLITWTNPKMAGTSKERLSRLVGATILAIAGVSFLAAGALAIGLPRSVVGPLYYGAVIVLVVVQYLLVRVG